MVSRPSVIAAASACVFAVITLASCGDDSVTGPQVINYPAKATDVSPFVWGTLTGVSIAGGYGSAVVVDPRDASIFYVLTDRGPNVTTPVANQLIFSLPTFNPQIGKFQLVGDSIKRIAAIELKNAAGVRLSGIPNPAGAGGTGETAIGPTGASIAPDPDGVDSEGLAIATDGSFWISDEYGPHILHVDATGRTIERINPFGSGTGGRRLPLVLAKRRPNRGMEGLTISPDGKTIIGMMQSPLDNPSTAIGRASNVLRIVTFDIASGATKQYVYETDAVGFLSSEISAISATAFLVLERDQAFQGAATGAAVQKKIYKIDVAAATDVSDPTDAAGGKLFGGKVLEALTPAERVANGIVPVTKTLVTDLLQLSGGYPHDKAEGVALIGSNTLLVSNDDDFGVVDNGASGISSKVLPATQRQDRLFLYFIKLTTPLR